MDSSRCIIFVSNFLVINFIYRIYEEESDDTVLNCSPMHVRMAERSKAPDSRVKSLPTTTREHSGPRMWAWVRIPLLTERFKGNQVNTQVTGVKSEETTREHCLPFHMRMAARN